MHRSTHRLDTFAPGTRQQNSVDRYRIRLQNRGHSMQIRNHLECEIQHPTRADWHVAQWSQASTGSCCARETKRARFAKGYRSIQASPGNPRIPYAAGSNLSWAKIPEAQSKACRTSHLQRWNERSIDAVATHRRMASSGTRPRRGQSLERHPVVDR